MKKLLEVFMKKICKKQIKKNLELKKYWKQKETKCLSNGKDVTILLILGLIQSIL